MRRASPDHRRGGPCIRGMWAHPTPGWPSTPAKRARGRPVIGALAAKGPIQASFTERRYFPFRREPTVLKGVLRVSPAHGLSLEYTAPEPGVIIADSAGLVVRSRDGRSHELAAGSREGGAVASLLPVMSFDLPALYPTFAIRFLRTGADWRFEFTPKDSGAARALGTITVAGSGSEVRHLEFRRSAPRGSRSMSARRGSGATFSPAELATYFR